MSGFSSHSHARRTQRQVNPGPSATGGRRPRGPRLQMARRACRPPAGCAAQPPLALAELAPDVQQHNKGNEEQAEHEHRRGAAARERERVRREAWASETGPTQAGADAQTRGIRCTGRVVIPTRREKKSVSLRTSSGLERRPCRSGECRHPGRHQPDGSRRSACAHPPRGVRLCRLSPLGERSRCFQAAW